MGVEPERKCRWTSQAVELSTVMRALFMYWPLPPFKTCPWITLLLAVSFASASGEAASAKATTRVLREFIGEFGGFERMAAGTLPQGLHYFRPALWFGQDYRSFSSSKSAFRSDARF
jgi:hypothetical protein